MSISKYLPLSLSLNLYHLWCNFSFFLQLCFMDRLSFSKVMIIFGSTLHFSYPDCPQLWGTLTEKLSLHVINRYKWLIDSVYLPLKKKYAASHFWIFCLLVCVSTCQFACSSRSSISSRSYGQFVFVLHWHWHLYSSLRVTLSHVMNL